MLIKGALFEIGLKRAVIEEYPYKKAKQRALIEDLVSFSMSTAPRIVQIEGALFEIGLKRALIEEYPYK